MEGLINGLIDVALGGHDGRNEDPAPQHRDDRSRSTWAEVVSGEQDDDHGRRQNQDQDGRRHHHQSRWNNQVSYSDQPQSQSALQEWEVAGSTPARPTQPVVQEGTERYGSSEHHNFGRSQGKQEDKEKNDDGWETVKKPPRKSHKVEMDHWHGYKQAASEQHYADEEVLTGGSIEPSEEELSDLSQACNKLWELDSNRLVAGRDYEIECGEGKKVYQRDDVAEGNLFSWIGEDVLRRPTISRFCSLLDNYNPHQGCREEVTGEEKQEQLAFIEEISRTAPIKYLHKYLAAKGVVSHEYEEFKRMLRELWFNLYGRGGTSGCSSAFEHVFVGEIKQRGEQEVSGFHNWLQFYLEEAKGRVDYQGYIFPRRRGQTPDSETQVLTIQFEWNGVLKSVSSTLVGVSPEFEIALYTLCFFVGGEDNRIQLGPYAVNIKCYRLGNRIGSVFPISE